MWCVTPASAWVPRNRCQHTLRRAEGAFVQDARPRAQQGQSRQTAGALTRERTGHRERASRGRWALSISAKLRRASEDPLPVTGEDSLRRCGHVEGWKVRALLLPGCQPTSPRRASGGWSLPRPHSGPLQILPWSRAQRLLHGEGRRGLAAPQSIPVIKHTYAWVRLVRLRAPLLSRKQPSHRNCPLMSGNIAKDNKNI